MGNYKWVMEERDAVSREGKSFRGLLYTAGADKDP